MGSFTIAPAAGSNQAPAGMRRLDLFPPLCPERPGPRIAASPSNGSDMGVMEGALYPIPTSALNNPIGKSRVRPAWLPSHYPHPAIRPDKAKGRVFAEGPKRSQSGPYGHFDFRVCRALATLAATTLVVTLATLAAIIARTASPLSVRRNPRRLRSHSSGGRWSLHLPEQAIHPGRRGAV